MSPTAGVTSGSWPIPSAGEVSANVFYRVILTVRDSGGLTQTVTTDLRPRTTTITLASNPAGRQLTLDGQPVTRRDMRLRGRAVGQDAFAIHPFDDVPRVPLPVLGQSLQ